MINNLLMYAAYLLGASIFILDVIKKYQEIADAHPDQEIVYNKKTFLKKELINIIQIFLYGVISVIVLPILFGGNTFSLIAHDGRHIWSIPVKQALIPLQIVVGYGGGRLVIAWMGRSEKELMDRIGIKNQDSKP
jgi:hypothetical protein